MSSGYSSGSFNRLKVNCVDTITEEPNIDEGSLLDGADGLGSFDLPSDLDDADIGKTKSGYGYKKSEIGSLLRAEVCRY